ncbi:MAG: class I SAM-dependent methyltransferase, partial [Bacteroidota bacterium]
YYQSEEYISHSNTNKGFINGIYQIVRNITLRQKRKLVERLSGKKSGLILDIGCGTGEFLGTMKQAGWDTKGLEPDEGARQQAIQHFDLSVDPSDQLFSLEENKFDVISMWHVLEHVHQLQDYISKIRKLLKKDGTLIIAVPNFQSTDAEHYDSKWAAYDVPRHLYHFNPLAMDTLMGKHQFTVHDHRRMPFDAFYVSMLSEQYRHGKLRLIPAFFSGLASWWHNLFHKKRGSSIIYVIRPQ